MFRSQQIIIRKYVCTSLKLLKYLENTEFKTLKNIPGVVAAKRVVGTRGDPCGAVRWTPMLRTAVRHTSSHRKQVHTPNVMLPHHHIDFYIFN